MNTQIVRRSNREVILDGLNGSWIYTMSYEALKVRPDRVLDTLTITRAKNRATGLYDIFTSDLRHQPYCQKQHQQLRATCYQILYPLLTEAEATAYLGELELKHRTRMKEISND